MRVVYVSPARAAWLGAWTFFRACVAVWRPGLGGLRTRLSILADPNKASYVVNGNVRYVVLDPRKEVVKPPDSGSEGQDHEKETR